MYKVITRSNWFLIPVGRPLRSNSSYIATEKKMFYGRISNYYCYKINGTWYREDIFKEIIEMKDNNKVREELTGREFKCDGPSNIRDIVYTINKCDDDNYNITWMSPKTTDKHESKYNASKVNSAIDTKRWSLIEGFELPAKWCIKLDKENIKVLRRYSGVAWSDPIGYVHSQKINSTNEWGANVEKGYKEITFEQFEKYVLKEDIHISKTSTEGKSYTYEQIERIIKKDFGKEDAEEILESIKKIK